MARVVALLITVWVLALPLAADAKGGKGGGGHCASSGHSSSHSGKGSAAGFRSSSFSSFFLFGAAGGYYASRAGYVRPDGTYVEPAREEAPAEPPQEFRNDCPPGMDCKPLDGPSAG